MGLFGGKASKDGVPVEEVKTMKGQGIDNNRIIQTLQRDGYSSSQIFEAMNQSDMKIPTDNPDKQPALDTGTQPTQPAPDQPLSQTPPEKTGSFYQSMDQQAFKQPQQPLGTIPAFNQPTPEVEEMVESIIEEKWEDIVKDINKIVDWKNSTESKLSTLEHEFLSLKAEFDKLHQAVIGKIGEYDKNILNVGAEVKAMEKVFSKVLPVFTDKVNQLADVSDALKKRSNK